MSEGVARLREIVSRLRSPGGCPWDREQTHESLRGALIEECYEAVDAINRADDSNLREELGDLLLLVTMHAQMGEERGAFHFEEIASAICEKLIRRHPHVFGDSTASDSGEVLKQWEQIKRGEKGEGASVLDGLARALPALMLAQNVQKKVSRVGFDWGDTSGVLDKIEEEIAEVREAIAAGHAEGVREETGDLLFSVVNLARKLGVESETALVGATDKFVARFKAVEREIGQGGRRIEDASPEEMNAIWERHKAATR